MKNKELLLRRMQTLEGMLKKLRLSLNENDTPRARQILNDILELRQDIESIIEREN
tara:strand:+ start:1391 stop:1558 length:168 start_codon:yes stop_codon:yes gene_type:complete